MKLWVDALTPKQLMFFQHLRIELENMGHTVYMTTRRYHDAEYVMNRLRIEAKVVGIHGGASKESKLEASLSRCLDLVKEVTKEQVDRTISFSSPEAARVSSGLGIPHYAVNDSPHSAWVAKLALPLSTKLFAPWVIPKSAWRNYGIKGKDILTYRALDPAAWLKRRESWPEPTEFERKAENSILFRPEESQASYLKGARSGIGIVRLISEMFPDRLVVVLPRYSEQEDEFSNIEAPNVIVCREPFFGPNLLARCAALVGGGGTMNAEAALLGIPTVSFFPGKTTYVEEYLVKRGLVKRVKGDRDCVRTLSSLLEPATRAALKETATDELAEMEDPISRIVQGVLYA